MGVHLTLELHWQLRSWTQSKINQKIHRKQKYQKFIEYKHIRFYNGGYFCIEFIDLMVKGKSLLDCTNLFYPNKHEMNEQIILKYSQ